MAPIGGEKERGRGPVCALPPAPACRQSRFCLPLVLLIILLLAVRLLVAALLDGVPLDSLSLFDGVRLGLKQHVGGTEVM